MDTLLLAASIKILHTNANLQDFFLLSMGIVRLPILYWLQYLIKKLHDLDHQGFINTLYICNITTNLVHSELIQAHVALPSNSNNQISNCLRTHTQADN